MRCLKNRDWDLHGLNSYFFIWGYLELTFSNWLKGLVMEGLFALGKSQLSHQSKTNGFQGPFSW
jgi:hypothetical protein